MYEITKQDERCAKMIAFAIVSMANIEEGSDGLEWLVNNSFILDGKYERVAKQLYEEIPDEMIDLIDKYIGRGIMNVR